MFKRLFWLVTGFVLGLGSSWAVLRRVRRVAARYAPADVAERWGDRARATRAAVAEGRAAMRAREAELRAALEPGGRDRGGFGPGAARNGQ